MTGMQGRSCLRQCLREGSNMQKRNKMGLKTKLHPSLWIITEICLSHFYSWLVFVVSQWFFLLFVIGSDYSQYINYPYSSCHLWTSLKSFGQESSNVEDAIHSKCTIQIQITPHYLPHLTLTHWIMLWLTSLPGHFQGILRYEWNVTHYRRIKHTCWWVILLHQGDPCNALLKSNCIDNYCFSVGHWMSPSLRNSLQHSFFFYLTNVVAILYIQNPSPLNKEIILTKILIPITTFLSSLLSVCLYLGIMSQMRYLVFHSLVSSISFTSLHAKI